MSEEPSRQPILNVPAVVVAWIAILVAVQLIRLAIPISVDSQVVAGMAFVPIRLTAAFDSGSVASRLQFWLASSDPALQKQFAFAVAFLREVHTPAILTCVTYALLHGGWAHLGLNGIWLLAFGTPVARRLGSWRFVFLMIVSAVLGALTHWALFPFGVEPLVGASAAVSGCMGAASRFAFRAQGFGDQSRPDGPASSLLAVIRDRRALSFLIAWFISNALFGIGSESFGLTDAPVAWQAHIGGFLAGLLLFPWFDPPARLLQGTEPPCAAA